MKSDQDRGVERGDGEKGCLMTPPEADKKKKTGAKERTEHDTSTDSHRPHAHNMMMVIIVCLRPRSGSRPKGLAKRGLGGASDFTATRLQGRG